MELFKLLGTIAIDAGDSEGKLDTISSKASSTSQKIGSAFTNIGTKAASVSKAFAPVSLAIGGAATALGGLATKSAGTMDNIDKMSQKIGVSREAYQELDFICSQSGMSVDSLQMGLKTLTGQMDKVSEGNKNATAVFKELDVEVQNSDGTFRSQEEVMWETIASLQGMEDQTKKARLATELFGRSGSEMMPLLNGASGSIEEMKQQAHDLGLVMSDESVDAGVEFTDTLDQFKRSASAAAASAGSELLPTLTDLLKLLIEKGVPAFQKVAEKIGEVVSWFTNLDESGQKTVLVVVGVIAAISPIAGIISGISTVLGVLIPLLSGVAAGVAAISAPVLIVIAVIGSLIAVGVLLYKNWDTIKEKATELKDKISETFGNIKDAIKEKIESAKDFVKSAIDKIKGFFKFEWSLPKLKLPHFKIKGEFSLNPLSVPSIGVDWYKKAMDEPMIMNSPTAFGINKNGQIMAGGEAGSEVVSGTDTLMNMISEAVSAKNQRLEEILQSILSYMPQMANMQVVMDTGATVGALVAPMDKELGRRAARSGRGV